MGLLNMIHTTLKDGTQIDHIKLEDVFAVTIKDIYGQMVDFDITFSELENITENELKNITESELKEMLNESRN